MTCIGTKTDGTPCSYKYPRSNGYCYWHQDQYVAPTTSTTTKKIIQGAAIALIILTLYMNPLVGTLWNPSMNITGRGSLYICPQSHDVYATAWGIDIDMEYIKTNGVTKYGNLVNSGANKGCYYFRSVGRDGETSIVELAMRELKEGHHHVKIKFGTVKKGYVYGDFYNEAIPEYLLENITNFEQINNSKVYMGITNWTYGEDDPIIKFKPKKLSAAYDIIFGFDSDARAKIKGGYYYNPKTWEETVYSSRCDGINQIANTTTGPFPKIAECWYNQTTLEDISNGTIYKEEYNLIFGRVVNGIIPSTKQGYWNITKSSEYDKIPNNKYTKTTYQYQEWDTWYWLKNKFMAVNQTYQMKLDFDYEITQEENSGKYIYCAKLSSDTISQAITNDRLYCIDPFYNASSFPFRSPIENTSVLDVNIPYSVNDNETVNNWVIWTLRDSGGCSGQQYVSSSESGPSGELAISDDSATQCNWENASTLTGNNPTDVYPNHMQLLPHLDDDMSDGANDSTSNDYDGVLSGNTSVTPGKIGNALKFDGTGDWVTFDYAGLNLDGTTDITVSAWIKFDDNYPFGSGAHTFLHGQEANFQFSFNQADGTLGFFLRSDGWKSAETSRTTWEADVWYYVVGTYDGSTVRVYVNGVEDGNLGHSGTIETAGSGQTFEVGAYSSSHVQLFIGAIDEPMQSSRTWSPSEILQTYWNGINNLTTLGTEETGDTAPTVTLNYPDNNSINDTVTHNFGYTPTDDGVILNASLYIGGVLNSTNSSVVVNGTINTIQASSAFVDHTSHLWKILVCDNATVTQCTFSGTFNITMDAEAPDITILSPANTTDNDATPLLNVTFTSAPNGTEYSIDGGANISGVGGQLNLTNLSLSTLSDGSHRIDVCVNSSFNHIHCATTNFIVDTTGPVISHDTPLNGTTHSNATANFYLNGTAIDLFNATDSIYTNHSNWTAIDTGNEYNITNNTQILIGNYTLSIFANDSFNNTAFIDISFEVIEAQVDTNFQIWNGTAWDDASLWYIAFVPPTNCTTGGCVYPKNVTDSAQNNSQAIYNITNNGTGTGDAQLKINTTFTQLTVKCGNDNDPNNAINMATSFQTLESDLVAGDDAEVWCWGDFSGGIGTAFIEVQARVT